VGAGLGLVLLLVAASAVLVPFLPHRLSYGWESTWCRPRLSFYLKRVAVVDVLLLSGLYTLRMLAGGAATGTEISQWLASFSTLLFLSLAMVKRFSELEKQRERAPRPARTRVCGERHGSDTQFWNRQRLRCRGGFHALYRAARRHRALPSRFAAVADRSPAALLGHARLAAGSRGELNDDPMVFAIRDRVSLAVGAAVVALAIFAA